MKGRKDPQDLLVLPVLRVQRAQLVLPPQAILDKTERMVILAHLGQQALLEQQALQERREQRASVSLDKMGKTARTARQGQRARQG